MSKNAYIWDWMAKSFHYVSSRSRAHRDKYREVAEIVISHKPENVLDLGCGSGLLERELLKLGYKGKLCGLDSSKEMLKIADIVCGGSADFRQINLDNGINIKGKFDAVVAINVMFFLEDKKRFLQDVSNLLKNKNSIFILVNPKPNNQSNSLEFIKAHYDNTTIFEKIFITFNELLNLPKYARMIIGQKRLTKMATKMQIEVSGLDDVKILASGAGLEIKSVSDIHANQNWLFAMKRL